MKKFFVFGLISFALLSFGLVQGTAKVAATSGRAQYVGYFGGAAVPNIYSDCNVLGAGANCLSGQVTPAIPASAYASKASFIAFISGKLTASTLVERTGAAFIINTMVGNPGAASDKTPSAALIALWKAAINDPSVSMSTGSYATKTNSAYSPDINDDFFYDGGNGNANSILFKIGGITRYALKIDCGNPLGDLAGLPPAAKNWNLSSHSTVTPTSALPGAVVKFTEYVRNDPGSDPATFNYQVDYEYRDSSNQVFFVNSLTSNTIVNNLGANATTSQTAIPLTVSSNTNVARVCAFIRYSNATGPGTATGESAHACVNVTHPQASCGTMTVTPANVTPSSTFSIGTTITMNTGGKAALDQEAAGNYYIRVVGPTPANIGPTFNGNYSKAAGQVAVGEVLAGAGGTVTGAVSNIGPTNNTGAYWVSWGITGGLDPIDCTSPVPTGLPGSCDTDRCFSVANYPYISVVGGDVNAGAGFGTSCSQDPTAAITTYNTNNSDGSGQYKGSGTTLGASALKPITGFATGADSVLGTSTTSTNTIVEPSAFAFSNMPPIAGSTGGNFADAGCVPDYTGQALSHATKQPDDTSTSVNISNLQSGIYQFNNGGTEPFQISASAPIGNDTSGKPLNITIVVFSDAVITTNITYASYINLQNAPHLTIIVDSNDLYIAGDATSPVTSLSGFYAAQPEGPDAASMSGGTIYTCAVPTTADPKAYQENIDTGTCGAALTINGAVSAGKIYLDRTVGNIGTPGAAETINFGPELWAAGLLSCSGDPSQCGPATSIFSLPPVL